MHPGNRLGRVSVFWAEHLAVSHVEQFIVLIATAA